jgi:hypothetical protein
MHPYPFRMTGAKPPLNHICMKFRKTIIIIRHELGFARPVWASYRVFVHFVYNSALILAFCCLFLLHVVADSICMFLVSRQPVLLSTGSTVNRFYCQPFHNFLISSVIKKCLQEDDCTSCNFRTFRRYASQLTATGGWVQ